MSLYLSVLDFSPLVYMGVKPRQEIGAFLALKSPVTPATNPICSYSSCITPPPQGVGMDMEQPGYLPHRQHIIHLTIIIHTIHISSHLFFS